MVAVGIDLRLRGHGNQRTLPRTNLLADWTFKQGADPQLVVDAGPNALHLTRGATSDFTWNTATASFAPNQFATIADNALLDMGTTDFTVYFVFKPGSGTTTQSLISKRGAGGNGTIPGWGLRQSATTNNLQVELDDGNAAHTALTNLITGAMSVGVWVAFGVSFIRAGNCVGYKNGAPAGTPFSIAAYGNIDGTKPLRIGIDPTNATLDPLTGEVRRAIIYKGVAHSAAQQLEIYNYLKQDSAAVGITLP
jgi:hypothetical protein